MTTNDAPPVSSLRKAPGLATSVAQSAVGTGFSALARLRGDKPVHPRGVVGRVELKRVGSKVRWGVPWLDEPGTEQGLARFSRSVGLPSPLPDLFGLALRLESEDGKHDLLLATTGMAPGYRHVLLPRRHPLDTRYGSLMPYEAVDGGGHLMFAAVPEGAPLGVSDEADVAVALCGGRTFELLAATPTSDWAPFAVLIITRQDGAPLDQAFSFDPVRNPLPGLAFWPAVAPVREAAYAAARRATASRRIDMTGDTADLRGQELTVTETPSGPDPYEDPYEPVSPEEKPDRSSEPEPPDTGS